MPKLGKAEFSVTTFFASCHPNDKCGANGLPLTPNSIKILGKFQLLSTLEHPNLCKYIHMVRGKHERLIVVAEHYKRNLTQSIKDRLFSTETELLNLAYGLLEGLNYLSERNITVRNLCPDYILFDTENNVKISKYGMNYMTECGQDVAYPLGLARFMAPEVICSGPVVVDEYSNAVIQPHLGPKVDIWSLGLILLEAYTGCQIWSTLSLQQKIHKVLNFITTTYEPLDIISKENNLEDALKNLSEDAIDVLKQCLTVSPQNRMSASDLLRHKIFAGKCPRKVAHMNGVQLFFAKTNLKDLELPTANELALIKNNDHLFHRSMEEVYYLWRLAGGDLESVLKRAGMIKSRPPITLLPCFVLASGEWFGQKRDQSELLDNTVIVLSQEQLRNRLKHVGEAAYYPLLEDEKETLRGLPTSPSSGDLSQTATLPLVIREKDVEYQFHRIILYERLLQGYPFKKAHIWREARIDTPPLYRAQVWAALLEVEGDITARYDSIDKETASPTDRQIEVDIPRCHQYHELLSSPEAHHKFKRILKAWVISHPEYVYWQGLDSLCAPFLALNFNNEALAFACLDAFIPKYLNKFFLKDNSPVIQEYLAVFSHLIAYHDPVLSNHLDNIGFIPDLYAIPWFLTMYAHVFPLHKIVHLWDTLLLGNSSFPLCIGVAILHQLRDQLLAFGFNDCILLFSDMPEIDIERCVQDSIKIFCSTPKSTTFRQHARPSKRNSRTDIRPNVSYYSRDYNEQPVNDLSKDSVTIEELKVDKCPRISAEDLIELGELTGPSVTRSPTKKSQNSKPKLLVLDIRSPEEFKRGTVPGGINIPFQSAFNADGTLASAQVAQTLTNHRLQVKVVVGSTVKMMSDFANNLVSLGCFHVCILHRGIDVLRSTGLLTVPPADI